MQVTALSNIDALRLQCLKPDCGASVSYPLGDLDKMQKILLHTCPVCGSNEIPTPNDSWKKSVLEIAKLIVGLQRNPKRFTLALELGEGDEYVEELDTDQAGLTHKAS